MTAGPLSNEWKLIGRIPRDSKNEWMVKIGRYWNIDVIDIRLFHNDKPTKKGVRLNLQEIDTLKKILKKVKIDDKRESSESNIEGNE
jgi:hypothetical protein